MVCGSLDLKSAWRCGYHPKKLGYEMICVNLVTVTNSRCSEDLKLPSFHPTRGATQLSWIRQFFSSEMQPCNLSVWEENSDGELSRFNTVLIMSTSSVSDECHKCLIQRLEGIQKIQDDVVLHGTGNTHCERLEASFKIILSFQHHPYKWKMPVGHTPCKMI